MSHRTVRRWSAAATAGGLLALGAAVLVAPAEAEVAPSAPVFTPLIGPGDSGRPDGLTEPAIALASGSGIAVGGAGLFGGSGTIEVEVPDGAAVQQVIAYRELGFHGEAPAESTFTLGGTELTCPRIGGPLPFYADVTHASYRCDVTDLDLIGDGVSNVAVLAPAGAETVNDGAGLLVVYQEAGRQGDVQLVDGTDLAFVDYAGHRGSTVPQTFTVAPSSEARTVPLALLTGSIANGQAPDFAARPVLLRVTAGNVTTDVWNPFDSSDGAQFDTALIDVSVPAGTDTVTVELLSTWGAPEGGLPASLVWVAAALVDGTAATPTTEPAPIDTGSPSTPSEVAPIRFSIPTPTPTTPAPTSTAPIPRAAAASTTTTSTVPVQVAAATLPVTGARSIGIGVLGAATAAAGAAWAISARRGPRPATWRH